MFRGDRRLSLLLVILAVLAVSVAAPSVERPTDTVGAEATPAEDDRDVVEYGTDVSPPDRSRSTDAEGARSPLDLSFLLVGVLGAVAILALVGIVAVVRSGGDDVDAAAFRTEREPDAVGRRADDESAGDIGAVEVAAGRTADRLDEGADAENEIYRAWREMTAHLDIDRPEATTPGEFADAAVRAGMAPADVEELTRLFETVRYGREPVTPERVDRARAALRRIEAAYARSEGDA